LIARTLGSLCALSLLLATSYVKAADCPRMAPWNRVGTSLGHYVEPLPLGLTGFSPIPLLAFSPTGLDHDLRLVAQKNLGGRYRIEPVSYLVPYAVAGGALIGDGIAALSDACEVMRPLSAVLQGMAGGLVVTVVLKWGVGREWPNGGRDPKAPDRLRHPENAQRFRPLRFGLGAWPSGHTLSMFAAAAAFRSAEYELGFGRFIGYPFAVAVGGAMWFGDRHWASDVISGALLGEAIGGSVGRSFAREADAPDAPAKSGSLVIVPVAGGAVAGWAGVW
jgi:membrane-associated phospholipid phosphatase